VVVTDADGKTASQAFEVNFGGEPPVPVVPELKLNASDPSNLILSWGGMLSCCSLTICPQVLK
jgi:hypothetical protein